MFSTHISGPFPLYSCVDRLTVYSWWPSVDRFPITGWRQRYGTLKTQNVGNSGMSEQHIYKQWLTLHHCKFRCKKTVVTRTQYRHLFSVTILVILYNITNYQYKTTITFKRQTFPHSAFHYATEIINIIDIVTYGNHITGHSSLMELMIRVWLDFGTKKTLGWFQKS